MCTLPAIARSVSPARGDDFIRHEATVVAALREWGGRHGMSEWDREPGDVSRQEAWSVWRARSQYGLLTIRFTALLARRSLQAKLIAEMESHSVGRYAKHGQWVVYVLACGDEVAIRFCERISLERLEETQGFLR
jgi:hypothetical protein